MNTSNVSPQDNESELTLAYLDQLRRDPASPPPVGLDPDFAETIRLVARTIPAGELSQAAKAEIWRRAQLQAGIKPSALSSINGSHVNMLSHVQLSRSTHTGLGALLRDQRIMTAGFATLLVVLLAALAVARVLSPTYVQSGVSQTATSTPISASANRLTYLMTEPVRPIVWSPTGAQFAEIEGVQGEKITLHESLGKLLATLIGHSGRVNQVAWSPDGQTLASAGDDKSVRVWTATGQSKMILSQHTDRVDSVAWSPDGSILASASSLDGTIRLWTASGSIIRVFQFNPTPGDGMTRLYWSPDGKHLGVLYSDNTIDIWTLDGQIVSSFNRPDSLVNGFVWSPDSGRFALATVSSGVRLYTIDGKLDKALTSPGETGTPATPHWSPDGQLIAVSGLMKGPSNTLLLWDARSGQLVASGQYTGSILDIAFSPDSKLLAIGLVDGDSGRIELTDRAANVLTTFRATQTVQGGLSLAWSPGGKTLLGQFGLQDVQVFNVSGSIIAGNVNVTSIPNNPTPSPVPSPVPPTEAAPGTSQPVNDIPLKLGETVTGELRADQLSQGYSFASNFDGKLLVLLQSNDFAIGFGSQIACSSGGGGGGGGGGASGGSPAISPEIIPVCKDGMVRLIVTSSSGTETGKFTLAAYELKSEKIVSSGTVKGTIDAQTPYYYFPLSGAAGDLIHFKFVPAEANKLRLTTDQMVMNMSPDNSAGITEASVVVRSDNHPGLLIAPGVTGATGAFSLTVDTQPAAALSATAQTVDLSAKQVSLAFKLKGGATPALLKIKGVSGTTGANITVQQLQTVIQDAATAEPFGGLAPIPPLTTLRVDAQSDLSYKLSLVPDADYLIFLDLTGGTNDTLRLSLSLGAAPAN